jgi:predicted Fe-S protein YdhL (DUF1289 family)
MPKTGATAQGGKRANGETDAWDEAEGRHRAAVLAALAEREEREGAHVARAHPDRARQFMPFAALKGYRELIEQREREAREADGRRPGRGKGSGGAPASPPRGECDT